MKASAHFCKAVLLPLWMLLLLQVGAQPNNCILKDPLIFIHFGRGNVQDINASPLSNFERISGSCPTDGHYAITSSSPGCFQGDWFVLNEDHTPGEENGNMMVVNAYPGGGIFLKKTDLRAKRSIHL